MTIAEQQKIFREALSAIYPQGEIRSITSLVLQKIVGLSSTKLSLERFQLLTTDQQERLSSILQRLLHHEPVQYILGEADFCGLKLKVTKDVLIPRPETEELVYWIDETLPTDSMLRILDIGTGSGCIPIALAKKRANFMIEGCDISPEALKAAGENNLYHQTGVTFFHKDILTQDLDNVYDVIVSNPPYIAESEASTMARNVIDFEPHLALFTTGMNSLIFYQRIGEVAMKSLLPGGCLFFEIHEKNGEAVLHLLNGLGFKDIVLKKDINGKDRMVKALR